MIPQRIDGNDFFDSGVRNRVTACRKRLREKRLLLKANGVTDIEELCSADATSRSCISERAAEESREIVQAEVGMT